MTAPTDDSAALVVQNVRKKYGGFVALDDVSLTVERQTVHALLGPNGAGKSTLVDIVAGRTSADSGRVKVFGRDVTARPAWKRAEAGLARSFQVAHLFDSMTAVEHIEVAVALREESGWFRPLLRIGRRHREEALYWLETGKLQGSRDVLAGELSQGSRKALELVMALARGCNLLSIDEPTAGMGAAERDVVMDLVRHIVTEQGATCLLVEHDMHVVSQMADAVTLLVGGRVAFEGNVQEMGEADSMVELYFGSSLSRIPKGVRPTSKNKGKAT